MAHSNLLSTLPFKIFALSQYRFPGTADSVLFPSLLSMSECSSSKTTLLSTVCRLTDVIGNRTVATSHRIVAVAWLSSWQRTCFVPRISNLVVHACTCQHAAWPTDDGHLLSVSVGMLSAALTLARA